MTQRIFVFGSNLAGRHGKGAAHYALTDWGAKYGQGSGIQGNSYAIPTKDEQLVVLGLTMIKPYVDAFISFAKAHPDWGFILTPIGCGHAGYKPSQVAPLFLGCPDNVEMPSLFKTIYRLNGLVL